MSHSSIETHQARAKQFDAEGRDRLAIAEYETILSLLDANSSKLPEIYLELAEKWRHLGKKRQAITYYTQSITHTLSLKEPKMYEDLCYLYLELAQYFRALIREKPAKSYFEKALAAATIAYGEDSHWAHQIQAELKKDS